MLTDRIENPTPQHLDPPPLVSVSGTHRQIGQQIGEACGAQIRHSIENARNMIEETYNTLELHWEGAQTQARKYVPFAQERYPQYVDEMIGMAEGAGVPFDDIATVNAMEAVTMDALHLAKCTSMAVNDDRTADGHVLVAHNEDWLPEDEQDVFVVHATPDDEPPFLAMTYGGLLPNIGFQRGGDRPVLRFGLSDRLAHRHPACGGLAGGVRRPNAGGCSALHADPAPCGWLQPLAGTRKRRNVFGGGLCPPFRHPVWRGWVHRPHQSLPG